MWHKHALHQLVIELMYHTASSPHLHAQFDTNFYKMNELMFRFALTIDIVASLTSIVTAFIYLIVQSLIFS